MEIVNKAQREALKYLQKREKINQGEQQHPDDQVAQICREFWGNKALKR